jgi:hypothetical protein
LKSTHISSLKGPSVTELTIVSALRHMHRGTIGEVGIVGGDGPGLQLASTCVDHTTISVKACRSLTFNFISEIKVVIQVLCTPLHTTLRSKRVLRFP